MEYRLCGAARGWFNTTRRWCIPFTHASLGDRVVARDQDRLREPYARPPPPRRTRSGVSDRSPHRRASDKDDVAGPEIRPVDVPAAGKAEADRELGSRRSAIAATLARLGFISSETAERDNAAADILAKLLPDDSAIQVCLSCHDVSADGPFRFAEAKGVFRRPATPGFMTMAFQPIPAPVTVPLPRTEMVVCTQEALSWTSSRALRQAGSVSHDEVMLYSISFSDLLGAAVSDSRKGVVHIWVNEGPTLSFRVTPSEAETLCAFVEREATSR
jgi:hypothetical protein